MLKFKTSILLVLPLLLAIGMFFVVTANEKPIPEIFKFTQSPNVEDPTSDPNYELKDELSGVNAHGDTEIVPLEDPVVVEETLPGETASEQYLKKYLNATTNVEPEKEPYDGPVFVPGTPKTGGEDIDNATVIAGIPYSDADNTCDFVDDYDEACTWTATAPDAVYEYTPSVTEGLH